ncbi:MAG: M20 family metallopeptidase [Tepidisphaerales bacterium]
MLPAVAPGTSPAVSLPSPTADELDHAVDLRHQLHRIPELAYEEHETAACIRRELDRLGIAYTAGVPDAPTATVAVLGDPSRPCIALRADIDALPITEMTGLPYASTYAGRMHACGHDGHTANLLLTAAVLRRWVERLPVCVKLIFQPAEEGGGGADRLVKAGVLDGRLGPKVQAIYGLHGWPSLPAGSIASRPGPLLAATDTLRVTLRGRGCHGAAPHLGVDPIVAAAELVLNLQMQVSRETDPVDAVVVTVGLLHAGTATNIIPETAELAATVRTLSPETRQATRIALQRRCKGVAAAHGCVAEVEYEQGYPVTCNDAGCFDRVRQAAEAARLPFHVAPSPVMGGEDFAYYLQAVPGAFFFVGVRPAGQSEYPSLHNERYDFTDAALPACTAMFLQLVGDFAARQPAVAAP